MAKQVGFPGSRAFRKQQQEAQQQQQVQIHGRFYTGPIPQAGELQSYENISSGMADRIVAMAEKEQIHRHGEERSYNTRESRLKSLGMIMGFILAALAMIIGWNLLAHDKDAGGFTSLISGIVLLVGAFIFKRKAEAA